MSEAAEEQASAQTAPKVAEVIAGLERNALGSSTSEKDDSKGSASPTQEVLVRQKRRVRRKFVSILIAIAHDNCGLRLHVNCVKP